MFYWIMMNVRAVSHGSSSLKYFDINGYIFLSSPFSSFPSLHFLSFPFLSYESHSAYRFGGFSCCLLRRGFHRFLSGYPFRLHGADRDQYKKNSNHFVNAAKVESFSKRNGFIGRVNNEIASISKRFRILARNWLVREE